MLTNNLAINLNFVLYYCYESIVHSDINYWLQDLFSIKKSSPISTRIDSLEVGILFSLLEWTSLIIIMRRRHPEPTCRRGGPDSGSHLLDYVFQYIIRLKILFIIPFFFSSPTLRQKLRTSKRNQLACRQAGRTRLIYILENYTKFLILRMANATLGHPPHPTRRNCFVLLRN